MKYIPADKLIAEIERRIIEHRKSLKEDITLISEAMLKGSLGAYESIEQFIISLQQEQPIEGKQVVIITETDGEANIHWDCRSLDDVKALLASAQSFIADKQVEELRGIGSGPDYNTTEGRSRNAHKFQQEQPEVDFEKELEQWRHKHFKGKRDGDYSGEYLERESQLDIARHFYELGKARKEDTK